MVFGLFCLMPLEHLALVAGHLNRLISKSNEKVAVMVEWAQVADWLHALKGEGWNVAQISPGAQADEDLSGGQRRKLWPFAASLLGLEFEQNHCY